MRTPHTGPGASAVLLERYEHSLNGVFGRPQAALSHGRGARVWDVDGREYTDLLAGIAVTVLGHAHPRLTEAIRRQAGRLTHVSNFFTTSAQVELAERLLAIADAPSGSAVFFANSGTEANEAALKLARRHGTCHPGSDGRPRGRVLALTDGFHGRTMGALALTAKPAYREPFEPLPGGVQHVPRADLAALEAAMGDDVAAVVLEPVQGEAGVRPHPPGYLAGVRELCDRHGALMILDEVQTGIGRTGTWFGWQNPDVTGSDAVRPDAMTVAKGLGGGVPIGALATFGEHASALFAPGQHGTTFGGNPLACAAGLAVLETIEEEALLARARGIGALVGDVAARLDGVDAVRSAGALVGLDLTSASAPAVVAAALDAGFIINATGPATLRLAPPLVVEDEQLTDFLQMLPAVADRAGGRPEGDTR
ncbi:acetylornithine aminotransferase [Micrococcus cohnii]|uniref:Acetylornithine aminotransferase n=1 Tax=Micrococcus cohnii TaxID=993416 RepID=A0A7W7GNM5_9MICC|nr:acetylornithine transaminase [Micrococcus cohnii]MBB4735488.1 acetylornithine aminotransferase [Micrococcus cohnii]